MSEDRFPYNMPGRAALIRLVNDTHSNYGLTEENAIFGLPFASPTEQLPGRTYIEAFNFIRNTKMWFMYRRLDLGRRFQSIIAINVQGTITPRSIVEELNRVQDMTFDDTDVNMSNTLLADQGDPVIYRLRALPTSLVWYGEALIQAIPYGSLVGVRLMENGTARLMEDDSHRLVEEGTQWLNVA